MEVYLEMVELVVENEKALAGRNVNGVHPSDALQAKRLALAHRLRLVGSLLVIDLYERYRKLVFASTALSADKWPPREEVDAARDEMLTFMAMETNPD